MRAALAIILALSPATAQAACIPIPSFSTPAMFARYPATEAKGSWRAPDLRAGEPHRFRTMLTQYGQGDPDFAGRLRVVGLGCGTGSECPAFVDRVSGKVWFVPGFRSIDNIPGDWGRTPALTYRRDSRLLVLAGKLNGRAERSGISLYDWRADGPHFVRFVPAARLCIQSEPAA